VSQRCELELKTRTRLGLANRLRLASVDLRLDLRLEVWRLATCASLLTSATCQRLGFS